MNAIQIYEAGLVYPTFNKDSKKLASRNQYDMVAITKRLAMRRVHVNDP
jgi:hypothetical protein